MLGQIGLVVLGRRAFEEMAPAWSSSDSPMARILNALPKVVFAHGGSEVEWNAARLTDAPVEERSRGSSASRARTWSSSAVGTSRRV
jgi:hypothetical protein